MEEFLFAVGFTFFGYLLHMLMVTAKDIMNEEDDYDYEDEDEEVEEESTEEKEASVDVDKNEDVIPDEDTNNDISSQ